MENNLNNEINDGRTGSDKILKKEGSVNKTDMTVTLSERGVLNGEIVADLSKAMERVHSETKINFVIPTAFYPENYGSIKHYREPSDLSVSNEEVFDNVNCYLLTRTLFVGVDSYEGLYLKMWVGKEDLIIRKIEHYNIVTGAVTLTREIHRNVKMD
jgi:hypothetical protein